MSFHVSFESIFVICLCRIVYIFVKHDCDVGENRSRITFCPCFTLYSLFNVVRMQTFRLKTTKEDSLGLISSDY